MSNYPSLIDKLFNINVFHKVKLGLSACRELHDHFGTPAKAFKTIHVAGTNGKGSVCTKIAAALQIEGYKVGLFTSPHISTFRERIRINGMMISKIDVENLLTQLFSVDTQATFFELTTLLAFLYFAKEKVDYAVIETGLGGRLDATNIIDPELSIITSLSIDHAEILGNTIEKIAFEKSGIIKKNTPVVLGPKASLAPFYSVANNLNAPIHLTKGFFSSYEEENQAIAKKALSLLPISNRAIQNGVMAKPSCRFEKIQAQESTVELILDVAHNPDGFLRFFERIQNEYPNTEICAIVGLSRGKDIQKCFEILFKNCSEVHFIQATSERSLSIEELKIACTQKHVSLPLYFHPSIKEAISQALKATKNKKVCAVCGSFFIMSEVRKLLGIIEETDNENLNERF